MLSIMYQIDLGVAIGILYNNVRTIRKAGIRNEALVNQELSISIVQKYTRFDGVNVVRVRRDRGKHSGVEAADVRWSA